MGLRSYFGFGDRQAVEDRALTRENVPGAMVGGPGAGPPITPTSALTIADVFACVRLLAESAAILPLHTYRKQGTGRERVDDQTTALLEAPAAATTTADLMGQMVSHLALWGSCFVGKYRKAGRVTELGLLDPARVTVEVKGGRPLYTLHRSDGEPQTLTTRDVIHVRTALSVDGITGLSPIKQARVALGLARSLAEHGQAVMANGGMPAGVLKLNQFASQPEQLASLRQAFEDRHRGTENAGRVAIIGGEADFVPLTIPLEDLLFVDQRKLSATEVARLFRIPAHLINAESGNSLTYSTVEMDGLNFVRFTLQPYLTTIERSLSRDEDLFPRNGYCAFNVDALMRADSKTRAEVHRLALDPIQGWATRAEIRALEDLPPEDEPEQTPAQVVEAMVSAPTNGNGQPAPEQVS